MCWWSCTKPPEGSPLPVDLSPLACHLAWNSWFLRALPLLSGKEAVTPALGIFYLEVCLFTVWVRQSWIGGSCRQNIRLKLHPKPLFLKLPQQLIPLGNADNHLSCCSRSFLPLWPYKPTAAVPKRVYVCSPHPTNLFRSHPTEKFNNCQNHEQTETISRLYNTTMRCLQVQLSVMQKEEKSRGLIPFLSALACSRGSHI